MKDGVCKAHRKHKNYYTELKRKVKRERVKTQKIKRWKLNQNKFTMYMLKHKKAGSYQQHQTMPHNQLPPKDKLPKDKMTLLQNIESKSHAE